jgi:hypothetical protein
MTTQTTQPTIDQIRADVRAATADWLGEQRAAAVSQMSPNQWLEVSDDIARCWPCYTLQAAEACQQASRGLYNGALAALHLANQTDSIDEARAIMGEPIEYGECPKY